LARLDIWQIIKKIENIYHIVQNFRVSVYTSNTFLLGLLYMACVLYAHLVYRLVYQTEPKQTINEKRTQLKTQTTVVMLSTKFFQEYPKFFKSL